MLIMPCSANSRVFIGPTIQSNTAYVKERPAQSGSMCCFCRGAGLERDVSVAVHKRRKERARIADSVKPAGSNPVMQQKTMASHRAASCPHQRAACMRVGRMPLELLWLWDAGLHAYMSVMMPVL